MTVPSGKLLEIESSDEVKFALGVSLNVYGTLKINGGVNLTRTGDNQWAGISVKSGGELIVNGAITISYADIGLSIYDNSVSFPASKSTISNCSYWGIFISDCSPTDIENIEFVDNGKGSGLGAIYALGVGSNPTISHVTIDGSNYGLCLASGTDATLDDSYIKDNMSSHRVVMAYANYLDIDSRHNDIYDTGGYYALYMGAGISLEVARNYWGSSDPVASEIFYTTDKINNWYPHDTSPNCAGAPKISPYVVIDNPFIEAQNCEFGRDFTGAFNRYTDIITQSENLWHKRKAIKSLFRVIENKHDDFGILIPIIEKELVTATGWYKESLDYLLCEVSVHEGKYREAIDAFSTKAEKYKDTPMEVEMLARIASIYGDMLHDTTKAKEFADKAAAINPGQDILLSAYSSAGISYDPVQFNDKYFGDVKGGTAKPGPEPEPLAEEEISEEFVSVSPNPFNPFTIIKYSIKETSPVKLTVFSINGQKVRTLVDGPMNAGTHTVKFDGSDLATGVYFYRFESKGFVKTGRMLLVK